MKTDLVWHTEKRKIKDLKDHPKNPRQITKDQMEQLKKSLDSFNYVEMVAINSDGTILAGHMRTRAMKELGRGKEEIEVRVPNRKLTEEEAEEYLIRSNRNVGEWDYDILASHWDIEELIDFGFTDKDLHISSDQDLLENDEEEVDEKEFDESITDDLSLIVRYNIQIPNEDSISFKNQLTEILKGFPRAKMEEKI